MITDFEKFAKSSHVSSSVLTDYTKNMQTPNILEESELHCTQMDVFSRLMHDRIIYFGSEVNSETSDIVIAQLLYLSSLNNNPIQLYINSPGGSVVNGLGIIDTINFIKAPVSTICVGMAASMGAVLLSCGKKGERCLLPHSRVMIHQVSSATEGTLADMEIAIEQSKRCKKDIYTILSQNIGKSYEEVEQLCDRNNWFIGQEAVDLGIADKIIKREE